MPVNIQKELAALHRMTIGQLRNRYAEVHGDQSRSYHKEFLIRRIAWRIQANEEGDLTERARRRAAEIANDADLRVRAPKPLRLVGTEIEPSMTVKLPVGDKGLPSVGAMLTRVYKGRRLCVQVLDNGFEFEGERYRSLSAVAKAITGTNWNGHLFFGLRKYAKRSEVAHEA